MPFKYRQAVLDSLAAHGVAPMAETSPEFVRDFINDLYVYEIRKLRRRLLAGEFAKSEYAGRVDALRRRYPMLALPLDLWTE
jgi:hypothetical protein